jgi:hypothetical protein
MTRCKRRPALPRANDRFFTVKPPKVHFYAQPTPNQPLTPKKQIADELWFTLYNGISKLKKESPPPAGAFCI